jgi:hypothetical protein
MDEEPCEVWPAGVNDMTTYVEPIVTLLREPQCPVSPFPSRTKI